MERYSNWIVHHPRLLIVLSLLLVAVAGAGVQHLRFNPDLRSLYDQDHPLMLELDTVEQEFSKRESLVIVIAPKSTSVLEPRVLELIQKITEDAWRLPYANRVDSLSNFQHTTADGDDLLIQDLVPQGEANEEAVLQAVRTVTAREPTVQRALISDDARVAAINISFLAPTQAELMLHLSDFVGQAKQMLDEYQQQYPDIELKLSGTHRINNGLQQHAKHDTSVLIPVMLIAMFVLLVMLLRSLYAAVCCAIIVVATGIATMGIFGWLGLETEIVSIIAPIVIMTLAVADAVHLVAGVQQGRALQLDHYASLRHALKMNLKPIFLTSLTTVLGVITFSFTDFPPLRKMAVIIAVGVTVAFVLSVSLLPALLSLRRIPAMRSGMFSSMLASLRDFCLRRQGLVIGLTLLLAALSAALLPHNELNESAKIFFEETTEERQTADFVEEHLSGIAPSDIAIYGRGSDAVYDPEFMRVVDEFVQWVGSQPGVRHVSSITHTLKRLNRSLHGDDPAYYRLPERRDLIAQYLLLYELSLPAGLELTHQLNIDKSATLVSITRRTATAAAAVTLKRDIADWFATHAPHLRVVVTGLSQTSSELAYNYLIPSMLQGGIIAVLTVSIVLFIALASVRLGLLAMLATCLPIMIGYGLWALYSGVMGFAIASVAGICLGVVVDFSIHFLSKYKYKLLECHDVEQSVRFAYDTVAIAILITMIVLASGFWVLTGSEIGLNSDLGLLTGWVIVLAALVNLLAVPAFLARYGSAYKA